MKYFLLILLSIFSVTTHGQNNLPVISEQQMLADFDTLFKVLSSVNPHDYVKKR